MAHRIGVIANAGSGRNAREAAAIERAMAVLGPEARLVWWEAGRDIGLLVRELEAEGCTTIVAAGGDGTVGAVAAALCGGRLALAVLPLGTFNFFARGLGLPEDPEAAARAILAGRQRRIAIGEVNGQVFLNNASLGLYPAILKEREAIYDRWGRYRVLAHWSVVRSFLRFQRPMRVVIRTAEGERRRVTPLIFVARSAYQLARYGLEGAAAISGDRFALFVATGGHRPRDLFRLAWRLVTRRIQPGRDVELIESARVEVEVAGRAPLVAFDGEKRRMRAPITFLIRPDALTIVVPEATDAEEPAGSAAGREPERGARLAGPSQKARNGGKREGSQG